MVAQIEILALIQKLKSVRVVDRRLRRVGSHGLQNLVYDMQDLKVTKASIVICIITV